MLCVIEPTSERSFKNILFISTGFFSQLIVIVFRQIKKGIRENNLIQRGFVEVKSFI